jgi:hypothetical protein
MKAWMDGDSSAKQEEQGAEEQRQKAALSWTKEEDAMVLDALRRTKTGDLKTRISGCTPYKTDSEIMDRIAAMLLEREDRNA